MYWRAEVIRAVFGVEPAKRLLVANRRYYREHIANDSHYSILAQYQGVTCGCGSVCFYSELPSPDNSTGNCAYIMNVYVREHFRNKGIGHAIIRKLIEECKKRECEKIFLETTDRAKTLYSSIGFTEMSDMMKLNNEQV